MTIIIWIFYFSRRSATAKVNFATLLGLSTAVDTSEEREKVSPISQSDVSGLSAAWWMGTCRLTFFHTRVCVSTDQWPPSPSV